MEVLRTTAEDPFFVGTINCSDMPHHLFKLEDACIFFCHSGEARIEIDLLEYDIMPNTQIIFLPNSIINYSYASPDLSISYITFSNAFFQEATVRLDPSFFHFLKENPVVTLPVERTRTINGLIIALEDLYKSKKVRAIGVSNFLPHHLNNLLERTSITPMVNQLEFHPGYIQKAAVDFCKQMGIQIEAWSPIGRARVLKEPLLMELAEKYQVSVAQICIRFALQCGVLPLPKSSSGERMHQNLDVFGFDIEENDMYQLMTLPQIGWSGEHPDRERVRF